MTRLLPRAALSAIALLAIGVQASISHAQSVSERVHVELFADPKLYGATGDGTTDDTTKIQAAIDSNKPVRFTDAGTYIVSGLTADASTKIDLGQATLKQKVLATTVYTPIITVTGNDVTIRSGTIDGQRSSQPADGFSDSFVTAGKGRSARAGIMADGAYTGLVVEAVKFRNIWGACIAVRDGSDITVRACDARNCNFEFFWASQSTAVWRSGYRILNNTFVNLASGDGSVNANGILLDACEDVVVTGNFFQTCERNHIKMEPCRNVVISGNYFDDVTITSFASLTSQGDVGTDTAKNITIAGNTFTGCGMIFNISGSAQRAENIVISDNSMSDFKTVASGDALQIVEAVDGLVISGNRIDGFDRYGMRITSNADFAMLNVLIEGNAISSPNAEVAIWLECGTNDVEATIANNIIRDMATSAVGEGVIKLSTAASGQAKDFLFIGNKVYTTATTHRAFRGGNASQYDGHCRVAHNYFGGTVDLTSAADGSDPIIWEFNNTALGTVVCPQIKAGTPTRTPLVIGEEFLDTTNSDFYKAKGTASSADYIVLTP